jgi:Histidine phosphatase superfamily (branch 1)
MANRLLYLARHGESEAAQAANPEDGELTETGRQQSKLLGKRLQGIPFTAIHHSPWTRATQTAEIVAEHLPGVPLHPSDLLQECVPAVSDPDLLTPSQAQFFDRLLKHRVAAGPAQAAALTDGTQASRVHADAGPRWVRTAWEAAGSRRERSPGEPPVRPARPRTGAPRRPG